MNRRISALLCLALFECGIIAQEPVQRPGCLRRLYNATFGRGQIQYKKRLQALQSLGFKNAQDIVKGMDDQGLTDLKKRYEIISKLGFENAHDMAYRRTNESAERLRDLCAAGIDTVVAERLNRQHSLEEQKGILFLLGGRGVIQRDAIDYGVTFAANKQRLLAIKEAMAQGDYAVKELLRNILAADTTLRGAEMQARGIKEVAETEARNKLAVAQVQAQAILDAAKHEAQVVRTEVQAYLASVGAQAQTVIGQKAKEVAGQVRGEVKNDLQRGLQQVNAEAKAAAKHAAQTAASNHIKDAVEKMKAQQDAPPAYVKPDEQPPKYPADVSQPPRYDDVVKR